MLQGRVLGLCGGRMGTRLGDKVCQSVPGKVVDPAVGALLVALMTPMTLEVTLAVLRELEVRAAETDTLRRQHIEQTRHDAELAPRGGATRTLTLDRPLPIAQVRKFKPELVAEVDRLLDRHCDREIADIFNERGLRTWEGKPNDEHLLAAEMRPGKGGRARRCARPSKVVQNHV